MVAHRLAPSDRRLYVPLLIALCALVIQLLAAVPGTQAAAHRPSARASADAQPASSSIATAAQSATSVGAARDEASIRDVETQVSTVWVRAAHPFASVFAARSTTAPTLTPSADMPIRLSAEAAFAASVRVRTLDASHELSARGALLPYFPTAPPLQG